MSRLKPWLPALVSWHLFLVLLVAALAGAWAALTHPPPTNPDEAIHPGPRDVPLPHLMPKYPGGLALRFAMVHDTLHERFAKHGTAYYQERNRLTRLALKQEQDKPDNEKSAKYWELVDDLGFGLDAVGEHAAAITLLRDKLAAQEKLSRKGRDLYTTYANLGTFLILGPFRNSLEGDGAKQQLKEGLAYNHKAIAVNPEAHFGRETWQAVLIEFFLAALDNSQLLLNYDMAGNKLEPHLGRISRYLVAVQYEETKQEGLSIFDDNRGPVLRRIEKGFRTPNSSRTEVRSFITKLEPGWREEPKLTVSFREKVPFDEPVLAILGMWRLGGGASPHFALCLGEIMRRVGQNQLAWCAYKRSELLADRFWPDEEVCTKFRKYCQERQESLLNGMKQEANPIPTRFAAELAHGQRYQKAYQDYETQQIAAGVPLDDPHFYDAFHKKHGPIASPVGKADFMEVTDHRQPTLDAAPEPLFWAGVAALGTALIFLLDGLVLRPLLARRKRQPT